MDETVSSSSALRLPPRRTSGRSSVYVDQVPTLSVIRLLLLRGL